MVCTFALILESVSDFFAFPLSFTFVVADDEKKMNATYIITVARKLGCTVFWLPEDIMEVAYEKLFVALT